MNNVLKWVLTSITAVSIGTTVTVSPPKKIQQLRFDPPAPDAWVELDSGFVAHALGDIDHVSGTNSYEALVQSYREGYRVFEVDLNLTTDNNLALVHDWQSYSGPLSSQEWKNRKVKGKFQPMLIDELYDFMIAHPDMFIVTDTKSADYSIEDGTRQFEIIRDHARRKDPSILDRIVPQIYNTAMYQQILDVYDFKTIIFTLYATGASDKTVTEFVASRPKILAVTMTPERYNETFGNSLRSLGKKIYFHTINEQKEIEDYRNAGIHGFYTDYARP